MKSFRIITLVIAIACNALIQSSCWNYKEIGEKAIITGAAVDYDKDNDKVVLTIEIATPTSVGEEAIIQSELLQDSGINILDAARNLVSKAGKTLFWSHTKIFILSEDLIREREKFIGVIDALKRDPEIRDDMYLLISKEKTAEEILNNFEIKIQNIKSFHIEDILKNERSIGKYLNVPLWRFLDRLGNEGVSPTLPTIFLHDYKGKKHVEVYGSQVFKGEKIVGWLDKTETKTLLFLIDEIKGGILVVEDEINGEDMKVSLEIYDNKTKITPEVKDEELTMRIEVKTVVDIAEIGGQRNVIEDKSRKELKNKAEEMVKSRIEKLIEKLQKEYESDNVGFGRIIKKEKPKLWKEIGNDWSKEFQGLKTDVNVSFKIKGSALRSKPIKVGE